MPLALAARVTDRFPGALVTALAAHGVPQGFIDTGLSEMADDQLMTTRNRSVVGIMNEFG